MIMIYLMIVFQVPSRIRHVVAHVLLMAICKGLLCNVLEIAKHPGQVLEVAMLGFVTHTPSSAKWPTPDNYMNELMFKRR